MCFESLSCFREMLAPQKADKTPLDMDQFRMLYCTCKVPGVTKDTVHNYFKTGVTSSPVVVVVVAVSPPFPFPSHLSVAEREGPCPSHLVVLCRGRIFTFDALCDGQILTPPELFR